MFRRTSFFALLTVLSIVLAGCGPLFQAVVATTPFLPRDATQIDIGTKEQTPNSILTEIANLTEVGATSDMAPDCGYVTFQFNNTDKVVYYVKPDHARGVMNAVLDLRQQGPMLHGVTVLALFQDVENEECMDVVAVYQLVTLYFNEDQEADHVFLATFLDILPPEDENDQCSSLEFIESTGLNSLRVSTAEADTVYSSLNKDIPDEGLSVLVIYQSVEGDGCNKLVAFDELKPMYINKDVLQ